jgi:hypothetical protein
VGASAKWRSNTGLDLTRWAGGSRAVRLAAHGPR